MTANQGNRRPESANPASARPGFSQIELLVVIVVVAVLAMLAVPALMSIVPYAQLRDEAHYTATTMRQARSKAASTQKPVRVVLDCSEGNSGCALSMQLAIYDSKQAGAFSRWEAIPGIERRLNEQVTLTTDGTLTQDQSPTNIYWAIFLPSSRVAVSHDPFRLIFGHQHLKPDYHWFLTINSVTGRTGLSRTAE